MTKKQIDHAAVIAAANELIDALDEIESFEVECGCASEGPIVELCRALGRELPPKLTRWLDGADLDDFDDEL